MRMSLQHESAKSPGPESPATRQGPPGRLPERAAVFDNVVTVELRVIAGLTVLLVDNPS
jgi:hypothetical protein